MASLKLKTCPMLGNLKNKSHFIKKFDSSFREDLFGVLVGVLEQNRKGPLERKTTLISAVIYDGPAVYFPDLWFSLEWIFSGGVFFGVQAVWSDLQQTSHLRARPPGSCNPASFPGARDEKHNARRPEIAPDRFCRPGRFARYGGYSFLIPGADHS